MYVSWLTNDTNTINEYGFECLELAITQAITIVMSITVIVSFHYSLIVTILILLVIMYFVPKLFSKVMNQTSLGVSKAAETATKKISDFFAGFDDLLVMNLKNHIVEAINQSSSILKKAKGKQATAIWGMRGTSNLSSLLSQTVVIDQAYILYVIKAIPIGGISAARYFAATIFANTTGMLANFMEVKTTAPIFEKYVSFLLDDSFNEQQNSIKLQKLDNQQPQITFDSVDFSYNTNTVLESCSFNFARGLVQKKRIWLVDEATSSLDPAARQDIEDRLMSLTGITLIMVSHRAIVLLNDCRIKLTKLCALTMGVFNSNFGTGEQIIIIMKSV